MQRRRIEHPLGQARVRQTLRRLLDAAEVVLVKHGPNGTTLPRIAKQAGVAPASVYRRFREQGGADGCRVSPIH